MNLKRYKLWSVNHRNRKACECKMLCKVLRNSSDHEKLYMFPKKRNSGSRVSCSLTDRCKPTELFHLVAYFVCNCRVIISTKLPRTIGRHLFAWKGNSNCRQFELTMEVGKHSKLPSIETNDNIQFGFETNGTIRKFQIRGLNR